jgi:hypothetical protein
MARSWNEVAAVGFECTVRCTSANLWNSGRALWSIEEQPTQAERAGSCADGKQIVIRGDITDASTVKISCV